MSIESFTSAYPADESFPVDIAKRPEYGSVSPVRLMADIYVSEGTMGLSDYDRLIKRGTQTKDAGRNTNNQSFIDSAAIHFGLAVRAIEEIIKDGVFDQQTYNARVEYAFSSTPQKPALIEKPYAEKLDEVQMEEIYSIAKSDRSFSRFFEVQHKFKYVHLPSALGLVLNASNLPKARELLLPGFFQRVRLLINARDEEKQRSGRNI